MPKEAVFTMKLEPELRAAFMAAAAAEDRPASQVVRELMRGYIEERRQAHEYDDFLRRKITTGRADKAAGQHRSHEDVEAEFAALRAAAARKTEERA